MRTVRVTLLPMHVRWSSVRGMQVVSDETQLTVGLLTHPLINADTGRLLGFFVVGVGADLFLSVLDIVAWGMRVHVRSVDALSPPGDLIRLQKFLADPRTFLHQRICIRESGVFLGVCADLQFDTRQYSIEWLFPRRMFFFRTPIAAQEILEVTPDAIWVEGPLRPMKECILERSDALKSSMKTEATASTRM